MTAKDEITKELQCLYAWSDFYKANERWPDFFKTQGQIEAFKQVHGLYSEKSAA